MALATALPAFSIRATTEVPFVEELLTTVSSPETAPATAGANCTFKLADVPAAMVAGKVTPETVKPAPDTVAEFTVTEALPVDDMVTVCVADPPTETLLNDRLLVLNCNVGVEELT